MYLQHNLRKIEACNCVFSKALHMLNNLNWICIHDASIIDLRYNIIDTPLIIIEDLTGCYIIIDDVYSSWYPVYDVITSSLCFFFIIYLFIYLLDIYSFKLSRILTYLYVQQHFMDTRINVTYFTFLFQMCVSVMVCLFAGACAYVNIEDLIEHMSNSVLWLNYGSCKNIYNEQ
jgi:hypothetical protein